MRGRTLVLAYHNVVPDHLAGRGDRSLHLAQSDFHRQLDLLETHCAVVTLPEALIPSPDADRPRVAITFDDAYAGAIRYGLSELARRRLPATVFVAPGLFGAPGFWWDRLAGSDGLASETRTAALEQWSGQEERIREHLKLADMPNVLAPAFGCSTEAELLDAARRPGVLLGSHTWSHPNLARIGPTELEDELRRPLQWLERSGAPFVPMIAYPYGLTSAAVEAAVKAAGYGAGFLVSGGWLTDPLADRTAMPRFNVPAGLSVEGLRLRLAGILSW
jgi:peptidoglycan/xylan/chitin deacetylase (PgdA/CDA1 family)